MSLISHRTPLHFEKMADYTETSSGQYASIVLSSLFYKTIREWAKEVRGDIHGLSVLDAGCGAGNECRLLVKECGASLVRGFDLSPNMIELAQQTEVKNPLGIEYFVANTDNIPQEHFGQYDRVVSNFSLCYAENKAHLATFLRSEFECLKPGGRAVNATINPAQGPDWEEKNMEMQHLYNIRYSSYHETLADGQALKFNIFQPNGSRAQFGNFYYSPETYVEVMKSVGFEDVHVVVPNHVPQALNNKCFAPCIDRLVQNPHMFFICGTRPVAQAE